MNDIQIHAFNEELAKIIDEELEKEAANYYKLRIPKSTVGKVGLLGMGAVGGAMLNQGINDWSLGRQIRKQQQ